MVTAEPVVSQQIVTDETTHLRYYRSLKRKLKRLYATQIIPGIDRRISSQASE